MNNHPSIQLKFTQSFFFLARASCRMYLWYLMLAGVAIVTSRHLDPSSPLEFLPSLQPHCDYIKMMR